MTPPERTACRFTLIELTIVVAIIAIISGIALPKLLKLRDKMKNKKDTAQVTASAGKGTATETAKPSIPEGKDVRIRAFGLSTVLSSSYHRLGFDVFTRYKAQTTIDSLVFSPKTSGELSRLYIPLPKNYLDVQDVELTITEKDGKKALDTEDLVYAENGLYWTGMLDPKTTYVASGSLVVTGTDKYVLPLDAMGALANVNVSIETTELGEMILPETGLQPSSKAGATLGWTFKSIVAKAPIVIDIPGQLSPMGRVLLLCRLVAIAVLLFGAGFWYLSEIYKPGCLSDFRWSHFMLLALTFSLFFIVFGILALTTELSVYQAMGVAAALSVPLLMLHVSRIIDSKFAFTFVLPLAAYSLVIVINGVYGGVQKWNVYVGAIVLLVGFLTITWKGWMSNHDQYVTSQIARSKEAREKAASLLRSDVMPMILDLRNKGYTGTSLYQNRLLPAPLRSSYAPILNMMDPIEKSYDKLFGQIQTDFEDKPENIGLGQRLLGLVESIQRQCTDLLPLLGSANKAANDAVDAAEKQLAKENEEGNLTHCSACGNRVPKAEHCQCCGASLPKETTCESCGFETVVPFSLISKKRLEKGMHCPNCGNPQFIAPVVRVTTEATKST